MLDSSSPCELFLMALDSCPDVRDLLCVPRCYIYSAAPFISVLEAAPVHIHLKASRPLY